MLPAIFNMAVGDKVVTSSKPEIGEQTALADNVENVQVIQQDFTCDENGNDNGDNNEEEAEEEAEELVDPQETLRDICAQKKECAILKDKLEECNARVEGRSKTTESCVEEIIDFMHCVDHCAAKTLFSKLK